MDLHRRGGTGSQPQAPAEQEQDSALFLGWAEEGLFRWHPSLGTASFVLPGTVFAFPSSQGTSSVVLWGAVPGVGCLTSWPFSSLMLLIRAGLIE